MNSFFEALKVDLTHFDWQGVSAVSDLLMVLLNIVLIVSVVVGYRGLRRHTVAWRKSGTPTISSLIGRRN
ncbi:hypothetical protein [Castellaniella sp.]|uniref:hypothetical protein n=1 Tax=Castellaniella sp. TaxID=1955812 RepID=UPI002AFF400A|nr:hypothetical protein [Castellaniella sp.]